MGIAKKRKLDPIHEQNGNNLGSANETKRQKLGSEFGRGNRDEGKPDSFEQQLESGAENVEKGSKTASVSSCVNNANGEPSQASNSVGNFHNDEESPACIIHCVVKVFREMGSIKLQLKFLGGESRDALQQIAQFMKNKFKKPS